MLLINTKTKLIPILLMAWILPVSASFAGQHDRGRPHGPPPEAIEACASLSQDDSCSFEGRRNDTVSGTCVTLRGEEGGLVCAPEGGPPCERGRSEQN